MATNYLIFSCTYFRGLDLIISNYRKCPSACQTRTVTATPSAEYLMSGSESEKSSESRKAPQPRAEPLNSLPTSDPAAEKDHQRLPRRPVTVGQIPSRAVVFPSDFQQTTTVDKRGSFALSLDPGSFCIFYNHMNHGPKYNFAPSLAFREVTGDGACWSLMILRNSRKVIQLWAALRCIKSPDLVL